jgi:alpha-beta hydrolase superfamily lysophospholipase
METLTTGDGLRLHLQHWPAPGAAHGTVQIVHGLGEHIGRYEALAAALNAAGWHVAGHDHRGHGRSEGARGTIAGPHSLLADLGAVTDHLRSGGRHLLLGHSLGGLIAARFVAEALHSRAERWQRDVDGLVLSSPALDPGLNLVQRGLLALASRLAPDLRLSNGLKTMWICRDPEVVRRYIADSLVHDRVTARLVRFIVEAGQLVRARASEWRVPTLLMWAGADRCVAPTGSAAFAAAAPAGVLTAQAFPGLYHEIFNEPEREQVLGHLRRWLDRFRATAPNEEPRP